MNTKRIILAIAVVIAVLILSSVACDLGIEDVTTGNFELTKMVDDALYEDKVIFRAMTLTTEATQ